jgi:hypothetical protein
MNIIELTDRWVNIDGKHYINNDEGRAKILDEYGEEDYNMLISEWGNTTQCPLEFIQNEIREIKEKELDTAFNRAVEGSFITTEGYKMQFNTDDSLKMFGAIQLLESSGVETGYITDADDNTHYEVPVSVMKSVQNQMLKKYAQCHLMKQKYRSMINESESIEDLTKINITFE